MKLTIAPIPLENVEDVFGFRVTLSNPDRDDFFVNLGESRSNRSCHHPDAITLILTDPRGKSRQLRFTKSPGHFHATGDGSPYVVPLRAASGYYLNLNLRQFTPLDDADRFVVGPGKYRLRAEFVGTIPRFSDMKLLNFWKGKLRSEEITFWIR